MPATKRGRTTASSTSRSTLGLHGFSAVEKFEYHKGRKFKMPGMVDTAKGAGIAEMTNAGFTIIGRSIPYNSGSRGGGMDFWRPDALYTAPITK